MCFDPASGDLIAPGYGLFDPSGNLLPSSWGSVTGRCVADGLGHVYLTGLSGTGTPEFTISKYSLEGNLIQVFDLLSAATQGGEGSLYLGLAPDRCTIYYGKYLAQGGLLNACKGTQELTSFGGWDDLRVLPDGEIIVLDDPDADLIDPSSGSAIRTYNPTPGPFSQLDTMSLDPDGTSFWVASTSTNGNVLKPEVTRFDIATGQILAQWTGWGAIAVDPGSEDDLGLTGLPADIVTDATSPSGARVTYTLPRAVDEDGPTTASVACSPGSGSVFPIGTTTVTCAATDPDDVNSPVTQSFTITVKPAGNRGIAGGRGRGRNGNGGGDADGGGSLPSQIRTLLAAILVPHGSAATITVLLSHGGYTFTWTAPSAGRLRVSWYQVPEGGHISPNAKPVLVAALSRRFSSSSMVALKIALTPAGKQLLRSVRRVKLTAKAGFAFRGKSATSITRAFTLTR